MLAAMVSIFFSIFSNVSLPLSRAFSAFFLAFWAPSMLTLVALSVFRTCLSSAPTSSQSACCFFTRGPPACRMAFCILEISSSYFLARSAHAERSARAFSTCFRSVRSFSASSGVDTVSARRAGMRLVSSTRVVSQACISILSLGRLTERTLIRFLRARVSSRRECLFSRLACRSLEQDWAMKSIFSYSSSRLLADTVNPVPTTLGFRIRIPPFLTAFPPPAMVPEVSISFPSSVTTRHLRSKS
mmetsp:Transcript_28123/g.64361  ORF Transcript_28123/g.64361 Transcript_28123/m.64361 type:complete len:244 (-) Transcript_28123:116-847(-)